MRWRQGESVRWVSRRISNRTSKRGTTRRSRKWAARPGTTKGVSIRRTETSHRVTAPRVWFGGFHVARSPQGDTASSLSAGAGQRVLTERQETSDVGQDSPREAPPARKARGVGFAEIRGASSEEDGRASVSGPRRLATANSPAKISSGLRQRELHWVPSSPHRPRDARSTTPPHSVRGSSVARETVSSSYSSKARTDRPE